MVVPSGAIHGAAAVMLLRVRPPPLCVTVPPAGDGRHRAEAGQRRAGADGHAGRVGQRAAVELDLAVGDALGRGDASGCRPCRPPASGWRC